MDSRDSDYIPIKMTEEHQSVLRCHSSDLCDNVTAVSQICTRLQAFLTQPEIEKIKNMDADHDRVDHLLTLLGKREDRAFDAFVQALRDTKQPHLAQLLCPTQAAAKRKAGGVETEPDAKRAAVQNGQVSQCDPQEGSSRSPQQRAGTTDSGRGEAVQCFSFRRKTLLQNVQEVIPAGVRTRQGDQVLAEAVRAKAAMHSAREKWRQPARGGKVQEEALKVEVELWKTPLKIDTAELHLRLQLSDMKFKDGKKRDATKQQRIAAETYNEMVQNLQKVMQESFIPPPETEADYGNYVHVMNNLNKKGRSVLSVGPDSINVNLDLPTQGALDDIKSTFGSGQLQSYLQKMLITKHMLKKYGLESVTLHVDIREEDISRCEEQLGMMSGIMELGQSAFRQQQQAAAVDVTC